MACIACTRVYVGLSAVCIQQRLDGMPDVCTWYGQCRGEGRDDLFPRVMTVFRQKRVGVYRISRAYESTPAESKGSFVPWMDVKP